MHFHIFLCLFQLFSFRVLAGQDKRSGDFPGAFPANGIFGGILGTATTLEPNTHFQLTLNRNSGGANTPTISIHVATNTLLQLEQFLGSFSTTPQRSDSLRRIVQDAFNSAYTRAAVAMVDPNTRMSIAESEASLFGALLQLDAQNLVVEVQLGRGSDQISSTRLSPAARRQLGTALYEDIIRQAPNLVNRQLRVVMTFDSSNLPAIFIRVSTRPSGS